MEKRFYILVFVTNSTADSAADIPNAFSDFLNVVHMHPRVSANLASANCTPELDEVIIKLAELEK